MPSSISILLTKAMYILRGSATGEEGRELKGRRSHHSVWGLLSGMLPGCVPELRSLGAFVNAIQLSHSDSTPQLIRRSLGGDRRHTDN